MKLLSSELTAIGPRRGGLPLNVFGIPTVIPDRSCSLAFCPTALDSPNQSVRTLARLEPDFQAKCGRLTKPKCPDFGSPRTGLPGEIWAFHCLQPRPSLVWGSVRIIPLGRINHAKL